MKYTYTYTYALARGGVEGEGERARRDTGEKEPRAGGLVAADGAGCLEWRLSYHAGPPLTTSGAGTTWIRCPLQHGIYAVPNPL